MAPQQCQLSGQQPTCHEPRAFHAHTHIHNHTRTQDASLPSWQSQYSQPAVNAAACYVYVSCSPSRCPSSACHLPRLLHAAAAFQWASNLGAVPRKLLQQTCRRCRRAADKLRQRVLYAMRLLAAQIKYTPHTPTTTWNRMHNKQIARHHYRKRKKISWKI